MSFRSASYPSYPALPPGKLAAWLSLVLWMAFFVVITRTPFLPDWNALAWAAADAFAIFMLLKSPEPILAMAGRCKLLLAVPMFALVSSLWSDSPGLTAYHATQFLLSFLVAFAMLYRLGLWRVLQIASGYIFALQIASLILIGIRYGGAFDGNGAAQGAFQHKNELGLFSSLQMLIAVPFFMQRENRLARFYGYGVVVLSVFLLGMSRSGTAMVASALVLSAFLLIVFARRGMAAAGVLIGLVVMFVALSGLIILNTSADPIATILALLGKDATLTGRSVLWDLGIQSIEDNPWLGLGFLSYWYSPDAGYLRYVAKEDLVSFHNTFVEVAVSSGLVGLSIFCAMLIQQWLRGITVVMTSRDPVAYFPILTFSWITAYCSSEWTLFLNSHTQTIFTIAAASVCGAWSAREAVRKPGE